MFPEDSDKKEGEILYEEIEKQIVEDTQLELDIYKVNWFSTYKVHSRRVNQFSLGRCFLAGDAAHIHSPVGAQGMNTGIQDGYNLAWKLAMVLRGEADAKILDTYNEEMSALEGQWWEAYRSGVEKTKAILNPTQVERFDQILKRNAWSPDRGGRGGRSGGGGRGPGGGRNGPENRPGDGRSEEPRPNRGD